MKRRAFLGTSVGAAAALSTVTGCKIEKIKPARKGQSLSDDGKLAGYTLEELRKLYRYDLFDDYLPFLDKYVIDHEYGGFMCNTDRDGTNITRDKRTWFEGRGIWVYSFLYNNLDSDPGHLEVARKSVDFVMKHKPSGKVFWPVGYSREGKPKGGIEPNLYGDIFVANGLQEYSLASGEEKWWDEAKGIMLKCLDIYDNRPDYGNLPATDTAPEVIRPRMVGHWFVFMRLSTQMLEKRPDPEVEAIVARCVDAVMNYHYNPEHGLINEYVNHDLSRIDNDQGQVVTGHGVETMWMVMFEAVRRRDKILFDRACEVLKRSCEVFWDDVYGGLLGGLEHVDKNIWNVVKSLWLQEEVLIGTLFAVEHTGAEWAKEWFNREYTYVREKFPLKQYGFPIWILYADRKVTFEQHYDRVGNFHHPRHLMLNLLSLDRMIACDGNVSELFA